MVCLTVPQSSQSFTHQRLNQDVHKKVFRVFCWLMYFRAAASGNGLLVCWCRDKMLFSTWFVSICNHLLNHSCIIKSSLPSCQSLQVMTGLASFGLGVLFAVVQEMEYSLMTLFRVSHLSGILVST